MKIIKVKNYKELSEKAFQIVSKEISKKPNLVISFASGKTALGLYKKLAVAYRKKKIDFSGVKAFNLDEYYPIKNADKKSFYYYMFHNIFYKINIKKENIRLLNGEAGNPQRECKEYEEEIKKSPVDLQILGLGANGHIAFNEPGSNMSSKTRLVRLKEETINFKKGLSKALTVGVSTIMKSKKIILLASGKEKAIAIKELVNGKESRDYPVTFLRRHKNFSVIIDEKSASLL